MKRFLALAAAALLVLTFAPSAQALVLPTHMGPEPGSQIYFVASLQEANATGTTPPHYCGGVLIAPSWIITAKQCTESRTLESITVRIGSHHLSTEGELATASAVVPHSTRDVALVRLSSRVGADPVAIADEPGPVGTNTKVLGWGQTCPTRGCGGPTEQLLELDSVTEPGATCAVEDDRICTRYPRGGGPCFGDEGGPLIAGRFDDWRLIGIVPGWTRSESSCEQGVSTFVNVTEFRDWIRLNAGV